MLPSQIQEFKENGFLFLPNPVFSAGEVRLMLDQLTIESARPGKNRIMEKDGKTVRSIYGSHGTNSVFSRLCALSKVVSPARVLLEEEVYAYQFKINVKQPFDGDVWDWHQDYIYWLEEDGMPENRVVNVVIFLDEISEFNGPLWLIPKSHKQGVLSMPSREFLAGDAANPYRDSDPWVANLIADIKYPIKREAVSELVQSNGIYSAKGLAGSVLLFDPNLVHASSPNISPFRRALLIISYNSVTNAPKFPKNPRPEFIVSKDSTPIVPIPGELE